MAIAVSEPPQAVGPRLPGWLVRIQFATGHTYESRRRPRTSGSANWSLTSAGRPATARAAATMVAVKPTLDAKSTNHQSGHCPFCVSVTFDSSHVAARNRPVHTNVSLLHDLARDAVRPWPAGVGRVMQDDPRLRRRIECFQLIVAANSRLETKRSSSR